LDFSGQVLVVGFSGGARSGFISFAQPET